MPAPFTLRPATRYSGLAALDGARITVLQPGMPPEYVNVTDSAVYRDIEDGAAATFGFPFTSLVVPAFPYPDLQDGASFGRLWRCNAVELHFRNAVEYTLSVRHGVHERNRMDFFAWPVIEGVTITGDATAEAANINGDYVLVGIATWTRDLGGGLKIHLERVPANGKIQIVKESPPNATRTILATSSAPANHPADVTGWAVASARVVARGTFKATVAEYYHGSREITLDAGIDFDRAVAVEVSEPYPFYLTAMVYKLDVYGK